jgi:signal transduction histidine kinase
MADAASPRKHPRIVSLITNATGQTIFAVLALSVILLFDASFYVLRPYDGMDFYVTNNVGQVVAVFEGGPADKGGVMVGDQILSIDGRPVDRQGNRPAYRLDIGQGDVVIYRVRRGDWIVSLSATMGSYIDNIPLLGAFVGIQILSLCFWIIGVVLCLWVPPCDVRARLVGLGWLMAGIAMAAGGPGEWSGFWSAGTTMNIIWCWLALVSVAAHLYFPIPSFIARRERILNALAVVTLLLSTLVILEDWGLNPRALSLSHYLGVDISVFVYGFFLLSVLTGIGLLVRNYFRTEDPDVRRHIGVILWGTVLGFAPFFTLTLFPILVLGSVYVAGIYNVLFFVLIPLAYVYVIYQRRLLRVDFVVNQIVVLLVLALTVSTASTLILEIVTRVFDLPPALPIVGGTLATLLVLSSANLHEFVQRSVNRVLYGSHYDFSLVTSRFSRDFAQTLDRDRLTSLLARDLTEQMGIQQALLFLSEGGVLQPQQYDNRSSFIAAEDELFRVLAEHVMPVRAQVLWDSLSPTARVRRQRLAWARLFVPIIFEGSLDGVLILGRRTSGDVYSDQDRQIIAAVARQAALAYANVRTVERLHGLSQQIVQADEAHRRQVARDLHDRVLQQLFFVKQGLLHAQNDPELIGLLDETIQTLRRMTREQHPPLLDQGLPLALRSLVEEMQRLSDSPPIISWQCSVTSRLALSDEAAIALYRIVQEALTNALKHAEAQTVIVTLGARSDGGVSLCVADDGTGIPTTMREATIGERGYGLTIMRERAAMINAELHIASSGEGTRITVEVPSSR